MVFWKQELKELSGSNKSFEDIYSIITSHFSSEIFSEKYVNGRIEKMTYSQFYENVESVASYLDEKFSSQKGGFIGIEMDNSPLWAACFFGILMAGFKPLLINIRLDEKAIEQVVADTNALCVFCDNKTDKHLYVELQNSLAKKSYTSKNWANEIALLSSGTTGKPKVIIYDGNAISEQILLSGDIVKINPSIKNDRNLNIRLVAFLPFYHIFGLMATFMWFVFFGRTFIFLPKYDSESIAFACKYNKATHFFAIPLVWDTVTDKIIAAAKEQEKYDTLIKAVKLSNKVQSVFPRLGRYLARNVLFKGVREQALGTTLKFCISGGGYIRDESLEILNGLGYALHNGYGMTETGILSVELSQKAKYRIKKGVGKPFPTVDYKITDEGVLTVTGPTLYSAEYKDGKYEYVDKSKYFSTNDIFTVTDSGRWNIIGRKGDIIIGSNGENISPDMIELRLNISGASKFTVLGLNDENGDEKPMLVLELRSDNEYEKAVALESAYKSIETLSLSMRPYKVYYTLDEIPQNLGKTKRNLLRKQINEGVVTLYEGKRPDAKFVQQAMDSEYKEVLQKVISIISQVTGEATDKISYSSHVIYDLGCDSMKYYDLFASLSSAFEVELSMSSQNPLFTPSDFTSEIIKVKGNK